MVQYISTIKELAIRLRPTKKILVNNQFHKEPGLRIQFHEYIYATENKNIIKLLDELLFGPGGDKWQRKFYKVPDKAVMEKIRKEAEHIEKARQEFKEKNLSPDEKKKVEDFQDAIARMKDKAPQHVTGPRSLPVGAEARGET